DRVSDFLAFHVTAFERFNQNLKIGYGGTNIFGPSRDELFRDLPKFDIIILPSPHRRGHVNRADDIIPAYWPELRKWVQENRVLLTKMKVDGIPYSAYVKPLVKQRGASDE